MAVNIPRGQETTLAHFALLPESEYGAFRAALDSADPSISIVDLGMRVASASQNESAEPTISFVRMLAGIYVTQDKSGIDLEAFVGDLTNLAARSGHEDLEKVTDWPLARGRLVECLSMHRSLGITARAFDLTRESERLYCHSRVLTDVRPVFSSGNSAEPAATVLLHTLRLAYHEGHSSNVSDFFITLETGDLRNLLDSIDRALAKDEVVRAQMRSSGMPSLEFILDEETE